MVLAAVDTRVPVLAVVVVSEAPTQLVIKNPAQKRSLCFKLYDC